MQHRELCTVASICLSWILCCSLTRGEIGDELRRLVPVQPVSNQDFGDAIDMGGGLVLVGAEDTPLGGVASAGLAYLFDAATGAQLQVIAPNETPATRAFGSAVALDGQHLLVAAEDENNVTGAAYLFDRSGSQRFKFTASDGAPGHEFGQSIAVSGSIAAVSAPGANLFRGQVYLFDVATGLPLGTPLVPEANDLSPGDEFGNSLDLDGDQLIVGVEDAGLGGAAYIFDTDGTQLHKLQPPLDPLTAAPVRGFGRSVAISGNIALVGATPSDTQVAPGEFGRAYLFDVTTGDLLFELLPDDSQGEDLFSEDLDISGNLALVAARREAALGTINQAYLFDVTTGQQVGRLNLGADIVPQDEALEGIAIEVPYAVGGVESFDSPGLSNNGIAIVFDASYGTVDCDFDDDGNCGLADIDALVAAIASGSNDGRFDMNGDGEVDQADRDQWLLDAGNRNIGSSYLVADANLDGNVDVSDFNVWNGNKFTNRAAWSGGDFNADGNVDVSDFNQWNSNKFRSSSATTVIPEPSGFPLLCAGLLAVAARRKPSGSSPKKHRQKPGGWRRSAANISRQR